MSDVGGRFGEEIFDRQIGADEFGDDAAATEHQRAVTLLGDLLEIVRYDQNSRSRLEGNVEQPVDLRLGADVDARRRILEDVDPGREIEPAPDHDLLLIA